MMNKLEEFMEKELISENELLSEMIQDIVPIRENKFTDLEIEADKKQEFSVVIYKKENVFVRLFKNIKFSLEKLRIMRHSTEYKTNNENSKI